MTLAEKLTKAQGQRIVDSGVLKKGDMVGYVNIDPNGDWGKMNQYTHSAMYAGKLGSGDAGRITCHTKSRFPGLSAFPDLWHLDDPSHIFSFFHFSQDDVAPLSVVSKLSGWWKKADNGIAYYYLAVGGRSYFTMHAPERHLGPPAVSLQSGFWFLRGSAITFIWKPGGDVDVWRPTGPNRYATTLNGVPRLSVEKITRAPSR